MLRDDLPSVALCAYLNAGTNGPLPRPAADAMAGAAAESCRVPRIGMAVYAAVGELRERARAAVARVIAAPAEDVALTSSTTAGIGLVAAGLDWREGDEVITTTEEHPGLLGPLELLRRRRGVEVRAVPAAEVAASVGPRTRMVAVSHVLWTTGAVLPVDEIVAAARERDAFVLLDAAQAAGTIALDVPALGVDFYALSGQKWLLGPMGTGALWVAPEHRDRLAPAMPGYLTFVGGDVNTLRPDAGRFDPGTIDPVTLAGLAAALEWVENLPGGRDAWLALRERRTAAFADALRAEPMVEVVEVPGARSGLIALALPTGVDPADVTAALAERSVLVRFVPGTPYLRISVGPWNDDDDLERLLRGLRDVLAGAPPVAAP
jgi:L-cysteine/cystine lyase